MMGLATTFIGLVLALGSACALAAPLQVSLSSNPTTCQPMTVTWDTSAGAAPWTVTVAPLGHVPISVSLPANYMTAKSWHWDWDVPGYASASQVIVAVSDSTGKVAGTSALSTLTKAGSCGPAPQEHLDFIWYPPTSSPKQCSDWLLTIQEDRGNLGLKMPVDLLVLPENDVPTRLRITNARHSSVDWTVNYPRGTNFAIASFDAGTSGTGGVGGQAYTVGRGRSASCIGTSQREAVAGLPAASSTASPVAASTSAPSRMATSRVPTTSTNVNSKATSTSVPAANVAAATQKSSSSAGVIGGVVGGVLGALAVAGLGIFFYKRQRSNGGPDEYGVYASTEKRSFFGGFGSGRSADRVGYSGKSAEGGRFGASTDTQGGISPFVTGRASPWRWSSRHVRVSDSQDMAQATEERRAIVNRMNDAQSSIGHSSSVSLHKGRDSIGGGGGGGLSIAPSVHSVVPDDALFPPPLPMNRAMMPSHGGFGVGTTVEAGVGAGIGTFGMKQGWGRDRSDSGSSQRDPFRNPSNVLTPPPKGTPLPSMQQQQFQHYPQQHYQQYQQSQHDSSRTRQHPASRDSIAAIAGLPLSPSSTYTSASGAGAGASTGPTRSRDLTGTAPTPFSNSARVEEQDLSTMRIPPPAPISTSLFDPYSHASRLYSDTEVAHINAALYPSRDDRANAATPTSIASAGSAPRYADPKESAARFRTLETQLLNDRKKVVSQAFSEELSDDEDGLPYMS